MVVVGVAVVVGVVPVATTTCENGEGCAQSTVAFTHWAVALSLPSTAHLVTLSSPRNFGSISCVWSLPWAMTTSTANDGSPARATMRFVTVAYSASVVGLAWTRMNTPVLPFSRARSKIASTHAAPAAIRAATSDCSRSVLSGNDPLFDPTWWIEPNVTHCLWNETFSTNVPG